MKTKRKLFLAFFGVTITAEDFHSVEVRSETENFVFGHSKEYLIFELSTKNGRIDSTTIPKKSTTLAKDIEMFNDCLKLLQQNGANLQFTEYKVTGD